MAPLKTIFVFRTTVSRPMDLYKVSDGLDGLMGQDDKWNFDLEDCDHILRVETRSLEAGSIIEQLIQAGYECAELEDNYGLVPLKNVAL